MPANTEVSGGGPAPDFWRTPSPNGATPDGTNDVTEHIARTGRVGLGLGFSGASSPVASLDVAAFANRVGTDGRVAGQTPLYVTGPLPAMPPAGQVGATPVGGAEVRHWNQTSGVGIAYDGIYATGSAVNHNLSFMQRGAGQIDLKWQALNGGINYLNFSGAAVTGNAQGWHDRWWSGNAQEFGILRRRTSLGSGLGNEVFWQQKDHAGTYRNALYLAPNGLDPASFTLTANPNNRTAASVFYLWGASSTPNQNFGFGIAANTLIAHTGADGRRFGIRGDYTGTTWFSVTNNRVSAPAIPVQASGAGLPSGDLWADPSGVVHRVP